MIEHLKGAIGLLRCCLLMILAAASSPFAAHSASSFSDYEVEMALIYNVTKFVKWPDSVLAQTNDSLKICVLGDDPAKDALMMLSGKPVHGRPIEIEYIATGKAPGPSCHALFVGESERNRLFKTLSVIQQRPILTLAKFEDFSSRGGIVTLNKDKNRLRFTINTLSARKASLEISSQLLELATLVEKPVSGR